MDAIKRVIVRVILLACVLPLTAIPRARADVLVPGSFSSLGSLNTISGAYTIDTGSGASLPTFSGPGGFSLNGVVSDGIAVFTFDSIDIPVGTAINVNGGTRPLALLSLNDVQIGGAISLLVGPGVRTAAPGGYNGASAASSGGEGPGGGPNSSDSFVGGAGGGFGGAGGGGLTGSSGGASYGNLATKLEGGSGGGKDLTDSLGGGGGALEIVATNSLVLSGSINAKGGQGEVGANNGGGGGAGGGIYLAGLHLTLSGILDVSGGKRGDSFGVGIGAGGGGGGRILIQYGTISDTATFSTLGGTGGVAALNGKPGVVNYLLVSVPELSSFVLSGAALICVATPRLRRLRGKAFLQRRRVAIARQ